MARSKKAGSPASDAGDLWEVAVALPLFTTLTYRLPEALRDTAQAGNLVKVPVGRRQVSGYLLVPTSLAPSAALKEVLAVLDPGPHFGPEMVPLFRWAADYYQYPLGEALRQIIPTSSRTSGPRQETWVTLASPLPPLPSRLGPKALALLDYLRDTGTTGAKDLHHLFSQCQPLLKRLAGKGLITLEKKAVFHNPLAEVPTPEESPPELVPEQTAALAAITRGIAGQAFAPFLLHGVTASGKTEVYLTAAQEALAQGRQVLVLLPEIALTHPVGQAFRGRFGERVTVLHSGLSEAARLDQWRRIMLGQVDIVVGARSAVFAPLPRLGLAVVDEEHDPAYKNEGGFLYHARDVALYRAKLGGAAAVLVSATPQITSYYLAQKGTYQYLNLSRRVTPQELPDIHLVNLREQRGDKSLKVISRPLLAALQGALARGEQALLFLNRRGYARAMFCLFCGEVINCRFCSVALTYHQDSSRLVCHYCGYVAAVPEHCPHCQAAAIKRYGVGTEKVEAEVQRLLPSARVARLDRDTAPHSGKALAVLADFAAGRLDILVGTQMITKGHHFPGVTLVGVIAADLSLFFPEYHAGERTFQLLSQVAGRAGRGEAKGQVLIQTYRPDHYVFRAVQSQDYAGFYGQEIKSREQSAYPPFTRLALLRVSGAVAEAVSRQAKKLAEVLHKLWAADQDLSRSIQILGPAPPGITRLQGKHRWQILLKSYGRGPLVQILGRLRQLPEFTLKRGLSLTLDIDPLNLF